MRVVLSHTATTRWRAKTAGGSVAETSPPLLEGGSFDGFLFDVFPLSKKEVVDGECNSFIPSCSTLVEIWRSLHVLLRP